MHTATKWASRQHLTCDSRHMKLRIPCSNRKVCSFKTEWEQRVIGMSEPLMMRPN